MSPLNSAEFQQRSVQLKTDSNTISTYCKSCRKSFSNSSSFTNHLNSRKHKKNAVGFDGGDSVSVSVYQPIDDNNNGIGETDDDDIEEVDSSDEWEDIDIDVDITNCLFCCHHSKTMLKNINHMSEAHTFFIPDVEYCVDVTGLLEYLAKKIEAGSMCLWCHYTKGKTFYSADAARMHMLDKGHCKMLHEGVALLEYSHFYDYSSSYPDANNEEVDVNEEIDVSVLQGDEYQLVLPSGKIVGHRSLMCYYQQNIDPNRSLVPVEKRVKRLHKVLARYQALGWTPIQQAAAAK